MFLKHPHASMQNSLTIQATLLLIKLKVCISNFFFCKSIFLGFMQELIFWSDLLQYISLEENFLKFEQKVDTKGDW